jgi:hypothetical protein
MAKRRESPILPTLKDLEKTVVKVQADMESDREYYMDPEYYCYSDEVRCYLLVSTTGKSRDFVFSTYEATAVGLQIAKSDQYPKELSVISFVTTSSDPEFIARQILYGLKLNRAKAERLRTRRTR